MNEEEIKKKMLEKMQEQAMAQKLQVQQIEETLKNIMPQILGKKARERLANIKLVKPELAMQLELYLVQLYQTGQIKTRLTDEQLVEILKKLSAKRDFKIKRK